MNNQCIGTLHTKIPVQLIAMPILSTKEQTVFRTKYSPIEKPWKLSGGSHKH